ncbi:MAG TPA: hypothetical protein VF635_04220 [Propionibacteriaceae bacterium]|jgi:hypothetical protein
MSKLYGVFRIRIFVADYATVDATNEVNALGLRFICAAVQAKGFIAPMTVAALVDIPPGHIGEDFAFELALYDDAADQLVMGRSLTGEDANALRFAQHVAVERGTAQSPALQLPMTRSGPATIMARFQAGLPLAIARTYEWRVHVAMAARPYWNLAFLRAGPSGNVVVG